MAINKDNVDDLEAWLDGLGSLRDKLLQQGLQTKEELLWLSQSDIDKMCEENEVPLFEKKRLEMKLLALQALTKSAETTPSPNGSVASHRKHRSHHKPSHQSPSSHHHHHHHQRYDSNSTTKGDNFGNITTDDGRDGNIRCRQPTIVRIVFSEAEEAKLNELDDKLICIKDKIDQIMQNLSSLNWEKDRLEKKIDKTFDEFVISLQRRREDVKSHLNDITAKQMKTMKQYIQSLNKQTKQIKDTQKKCEKYLSNTKLNKQQRKSKVLKVANKALDNKNDEKIIVPEIENKKKYKNKNKNKHKDKDNIKTYFVTMELDQNQVKRYIESIGDIRRVLVPYPPKFEIFTIEATRIKLKVWDQHNSTNKIGKKEKTEFMAKIAEQITRNGLSDDDEFDEMPENIENDELTLSKNIVEEENDDNNNDNDNVPDINIDDDEKEKQKEEEEEDGNNDNNDNNDDDMNEEYKYNPSPTPKRDRNENGKRDKKRRRRKKKVNWEQYPVYKPHDINDRKVMSSKYTIWIDNLKANTTYLLKLRGLNKYGNGDWTKVYSFVTKLTSFQFKSCIIKEAAMKNIVFDILCKKLTFSNDAQQFGLKRIFSTEAHGFSSGKFHEICDNKPKTLIIAESEYGNIFGGYSDLSWSSPKQDKWKNDKNAFLFLLRNSKKQDVNLIFDCIDKFNATRSNINSGPCFGAGIDLYFCDNCNKLQNSYSTPKSYNIPSNVAIGGRKNFKIKNYDVYIIV